jgi:hypothetical protein
MTDFETLKTSFINIFSSMGWDDAKKYYHTEALKNHPDIAKNDGTIMTALNAAWDVVKDNLARTYGANNNKKDSYSSWATAIQDELLRVAIEFAKISPELMVEITGYWVWVTGNTQDFYKDIKKVSFNNNFGGKSYQVSPKFHQIKKAWYIPGVKSAGTGKMNFEEIRTVYGSQEIKSPEKVSIR